ncbi:MAG: MBL fold metallo-hydrolase [candidate division KSB1 bacterium]|nr:MBL fold metallo-hydrolase [candidate division KSB1 bacterium]MDQ7063658.1 MBL fold metallo-hydrolase [candidate division KSB1 bacterium]
MGILQRIEYKDVEGIRVGRFASRINTTCILYRIDGTVIDTGPPNQWRWVRQFLHEKDVRQVFITHHHEDHSGNGANIHREWAAAAIQAHPDALPLLQQGYHLHLYRQIIWGRPDHYTIEPVTGGLSIRNDLRAELVHAPGHSTDMTCVYLPERGWLFTGDLYIASRPKFLRRDENPRQEIESLRTVLKLDFQTVFCAHRGVVQNGRQALQDKLEFLLDLQQNVHELARQGLSPKEVTQRLLGREELLSWMTFFHFSKRNLIQTFWPDHA